MFKIEVQYFNGCPHAAQAIQLAEQFKNQHSGIKLVLTLVKSDHEASQVEFRGSPTILINGRDLFGDPVPAEPHLACRFYPNGLPDYELFTRMVTNL